jgi:phospholipase A2
MRHAAQSTFLFLASADSQGLWFQRAEEYATARGLSKWPTVRSFLSNHGLSWPSWPLVTNVAPLGHEQVRYEGLFPGEIPSTPSEADGPSDSKRVVKEASIQAEKHEQTRATSSEQSGSGPDQSSAIPSFGGGEGEGGEEPPLGRWNCWIGSSDRAEERQSARIDDPTVDDVLKRDGMALVYYVIFFLFLESTGSRADKGTVS